MAFLPDAEVEVLCSEQLNLARNGVPRAAFDDVAEDARIWADHASFAEKTHYLKAIFVSLPADVQARFAAYVAKEAQG